MTKTIDMSVLSGQKIDCEFSELIGEAEPYYFDEVGYLKEIKDEIDPVFCNCRFINSSNNVGSRYCRPRLNHWHFNDGSMVLPDGLVVQFKLRSDETDFSDKGVTDTNNSDETVIRTIDQGDILLENFHDNPQDVIAVKILGLASGYKHEGMSEVIL